MKSNKIKTIAVLWFRLYLHVKLEKQHNICFKWKRLLSLCRSLNWADADRGLCMLGKQDLTLELQYQRVSETELGLSKKSPDL